MYDPLQQFDAWFAEAKATAQIREPTAMSLATASKAGAPSVRVVLLKAHDKNGFAFYTNTKSRKGVELLSNPQAALCFYWMPLDKQVRIEGTIEKVHDAESDAYFASRERLKQLGAWASDQSQVLASHEDLIARVAKFEKKFAGQDVPRPPHWCGFRLIPSRYEFWSQGEARLHERHVYARVKDTWQHSLLYP